MLQSGLVGRAQGGFRMLLLEHSQSSPRGRSGWFSCSALLALTLSLFACDSPPLYPTPGGIGVQGGAGTGGIVPPDVVTAADGQPCTADGECESGHCNNQLCCASGNCCLTETDCAANGGRAAWKPMNTLIAVISMILKNAFRWRVR